MAVWFAWRYLRPTLIMVREPDANPITVRLSCGKMMRICPVQVATAARVIAVMMPWGQAAFRSWTELGSAGDTQATRRACRQ